MCSDYRILNLLSYKLRQCMLRAETLTEKTEPVTKIAARFGSNLHAGEVFTNSATVDGTFVCDASAGDHLNGKYGDLQPTPLVLEIQGGRLVRAECEREDLEEEFWEYCHSDENSDRVGELAFGT